MSYQDNCSDCRRTASAGFQPACIRHLGEDVPSFMIDEDMARHDKYNNLDTVEFGMVAHVHDKLDHEVDELWPTDMDGRPVINRPEPAYPFPDAPTPAYPHVR